MANIKHTKNEMKSQREALQRFERFLPMLILKKQQLQAEIQGIDALISKKNDEEKIIYANLGKWVKMFSEPVNIDDMLSLESINTKEGNIAGVNIPILIDVSVKRGEPDLFDTPTWVDDAMDTLNSLINIRVAREILDEQRQLISQELRVTSQRVNLFEKVKIPECKENIRIIKIFLGDEQTAAVVRGKIAKNRTIDDYEYKDKEA